jgi:4-methyl-5(b-hydroxyethyl)-thiazole monophosphate biosynthesis
MVAVLLANGFETVEALAPVDILRRGGVDVTVTGVDGWRVVSSHGVPVEADTLIEGLFEFDMLVLPGGGEGVSNLGACAQVRELILSAHNGGKWLAAICAAPVLLAKAGLLAGKRVTCHPSVRGEVEAAGALYAEGVHTSADGKLLTGRAAGSSLEFGFLLLQTLRGESVAASVKEKMGLW